MPLELVLLRSRLPIEAVPVIIVLALVICLLSWYFGKAQRIKRELRAARSWRIADLPEATVGRIVGAVRPLGEPLVSPLTGRTCVYYRARVATRGKHSRQLILEERSVPFIVDDGTGHAVIDPLGAELAVVLDSHSVSGTFDDATPMEESFLARHRERSKGMGFNHHLAYMEWAIEVGETVAVLGAAVREPDPDAAPAGGYRDGSPTRLRMRSSRWFRLRISDDPTTHSTAA